ncbi:MAG: S4 domain-containing protein [Rhodospirillaceae bacterium]
MTEGTYERLRLDKWLWYARFCKTRGLAAELCDSGSLRCNGASITKAHHVIKPGDVLTFPLGRYVRVIKVVALGNRRGPALEAQALYQDLDPPVPETAMPKRILLMILGMLVFAAPARAEQRVIAPDSWFQRSFDENIKLCAVRKKQPEWCRAWIDAVETARPKTDDLTLVEWLRMPFGDYLLTCSTMLPPDWCPDWHAAMRALTETPEYLSPTAILAARRIKEEDDRAAAIKAWKETVNRVAADTIQPADIELMKQHMRDGDATAMELLGWIHSIGRGVKKDYTRAYEYYGWAVLAGREDLRPTLELLWARLNQTQKEELNEIFK